MTAPTSRARRPKRRADALADIIRFYLDTNNKPGRHRRYPHVELSMGLDDLRAIRAGTTPDGTVIDGPAAAALACGSVLRRVVMIEGELLDYGRAVYEIPVALFFAVRARDKHCRWPGCYRKATFCQAHHVVHWWHGGTTDIGNLALFCSRHHHRLHKPAGTPSSSPTPLSRSPPPPVPCSPAIIRALGPCSDACVSVRGEAGWHP